MWNQFSKVPLVAPRESPRSTGWFRDMWERPLGYLVYGSVPIRIPPYDLEFSMADGVCRRYRGSVEFRDWRDEWEFEDSPLYGGIAFAVRLSHAILRKREGL